MTDLSKTIQPKTDQLNADSLIGGAITITITDVKGMTEPQQPIAIYFEGDNGKPYKPCLSMRRVLVMLWGSDGKKYVGRSLTLYLDPEVKFGGIKVGGIRISHMSHIEKETTLSLTATKASRKPFTVSPLKVSTSRETTAAPKKLDPQAPNLGQPVEEKQAETQFPIYAGTGALLRYATDITAWRMWFKTNLAKFDTPDKLNAMIEKNRATFDSLTNLGYTDELTQVQADIFDLKEQFQIDQQPTGETTA